MSDELNKAARDPALQAQMSGLALRANVSSAEELARHLRKDYDRYGKMVRDLKVRLD